MACPFCEIVSKKNQHIVAENEDSLAVLDYLPLVEGHTLVIPKTHYESITEMPEKRLHSLFTLVADVERAILTGLGSAGADLKQHYKPFVPENEIKVNHVHVHIIPRNPFDRLFEKEEPIHQLRRKPSESEFESTAKKIKAALKK